MKKLKISPMVVNLECKNNKKNYELLYIELYNEDPVFAQIMDNFQLEIAKQSKESFGQISINNAGEDIHYINTATAAKILNKAMLTVYYLMQTQAEINELKPKNKRK